jgi:hypothetical protein
MATTISLADAKIGGFKTVSAAETLKVTDSGKTILLDAAAGATITLPALGYGLRFRFQVAAAFATSNWVIDSAEGDNINGLISDMGATPAVVLAAGEDQINFVATAESIGDYIDIFADYDNSQWIVNGMCGVNGGITATDPS